MRMIWAATLLLLVLALQLVTATAALANDEPWASGYLEHGTVTGAVTPWSMRVAWTTDTAGTATSVATHVVGPDGGNHAAYRRTTCVNGTIETTTTLNGVSSTWASFGGAIDTVCGLPIADTVTSIEVLGNEWNGSSWQALGVMATWTPGTGTATAEPIPPPGGESCGGWFGIDCLVEWILNMPSKVIGMFDPSDATEARWTALRDDSKNRVPFALVSQPKAWLEDITAPCVTLCPAVGLPSFKLGSFGEVHVQPHDPNSETQTGFLGPLRTMAGVVLYGLLFFGLAVWAWKAYAPGAKGGE